MKIFKQRQPVCAGVGKNAAVEALRMSVYGSFLASFAQGCNIVARASRDQHWNISIADCIQIWRAGCIIQSDFIADVLQPYYITNPGSSNALLCPQIAMALSQTYGSLKDTILFATQVDAVIPAMSASLEYMKAVSCDDLPTNFEEAELDYFGHHNYDLKREKKGAPEKGAHHTEWKEA